jgi:formate hydrogenlyase subunit 3/multisubunit Na+/H+ antiporter MnhD subunit
MAFGHHPAKINPGETSKLNLLAMCIPLIFVIIMGLYVPPFIKDMLNQAVAVVRGL